MGTLFRYVADTMLATENTDFDDTCDHCHCTDQIIYQYYGEIIDPELAADPELARDEPEIESLCAACLLGSNTKRTNEYKVEEYIEKFAKDLSYCWQELHKLPEIPLFLQGFTWPMCCGEWTEFYAVPNKIEDLIEIQETHQFWEIGPEENCRVFAEDGAPEDFDEVSQFRCLHCEKKYYTDQFT